MAKKPLSKLARDRANVGSKLWRNKADAEITRLYSGQPCAVCGTTAHTCGHHLIPKGRCSMHRHTLCNLIALCPAHHSMGGEIAAHSTSALVIRRFISWLIENRVDTWKWMQEHEHDTAKPDYKARYEFLKEIATLKEARDGANNQ